MTKKALVIVLGELARSPRMQYHCISLARDNFRVTVVANTGDKCCQELESNDNIGQQLMKPPPDLKKYLPPTLNFLIKPIWQSIFLIYNLILTLFDLPNVIIVQNPPSIPTLPLLYIYSRLTGSKLIIDWHNYGYSILSLSLKPNHILTRIYKSVEFYFGRLADAGFCVTKAMRQDLMENHNITYPLVVLYDRPPSNFKALGLRKKHTFFMKMKHTIKEFRSPFEESSDLSRPSTPTEKSGNRFTMNEMINKNVILYRHSRPAIIFSSTSWTEDEDFGLLLEALKMYDSARSEQLINRGSSSEGVQDLLPFLVCVITGKGPLKNYYQEQIEKSNFKHVNFALPWLSAKDYAKMVACADLGVSLHYSSSGVDLPMKVVDMFGCGVPALAYRYNAINELVVEDHYGLTFVDQHDLFSKLLLMLKNFHSDGGCPRTNNTLNEGSVLGRYKKNISRHFLLSRWEDNWTLGAKPVFDKLCSESRAAFI